MPTVDIPEREFAVGKTILGPVPCDGPVSWCEIRWDDTHHIDPSQVATIAVEVSQDGGASWSIAGSLVQPGGMIDKLTEEKIAIGWLKVGWEPAIESPLVRAVVSLDKSALVSSAVLTWG